MLKPDLKNLEAVQAVCWDLIINKLTMSGLLLQGGYMAAKMKKLHDQYEKDGNMEQIFKNVAIHVNGYTSRKQFYTTHVYAIYNHVTSIKIVHWTLTYPDTSIFQSD